MKRCPEEQRHSGKWKTACKIELQRSEAGVRVRSFAAVVVCLEDVGAHQCLFGRFGFISVVFDF